MTKTGLHHSPRLTHEQAVAQLRELAMQKTRANFGMGDIALDQYPIGSNQANNESEEGLAALAEEAGISLVTLRGARFVASRIPLDLRRSSVPWSVYKEIASADDPDVRAQLCEEAATERWTVEKTREQITALWRARESVTYVNSSSRPQKPYRRRRTRTERAAAEVEAGLPDLDVTRKVALLDQLLTDPVVRSEVERQERAKKVSQTVARKKALTTDPVYRKMDALDALLALQKSMGRFIQEASEVLPRIDPEHYRRLTLGGDQYQSVHFFRSRIAALRSVLEQIEGWLNTGTVGGDIDAFFQRVLDEHKTQEGGQDAA